MRQNRTSRSPLHNVFISLLLVGVFGFNSPCRSANLTITWDASLDPTLVGYSVYYATYSLLGVTPSSAALKSSITKLFADTTTLQSQLNFYALTGLLNQTSYYIRITGQDLWGAESAFNLDLNTSLDTELLAWTPPAGAVNSFAFLSFQPDDPAQAILVVKTDFFSFSATTRTAVANFPSGMKNLTLTPLSDDPYLYVAKIPTASLSAQDFLSDSTMTISLSSGSLVVNRRSGTVVPELGGRITEPLGGSTSLTTSVAEVTFKPNTFTSQIDMTINPEPSDGQATRDQALKRQNFVSLGMGREFAYSSQGTMQTASIQLPYDRNLIPAGGDSGRARIAYFNPASQAWEVVKDAQVSGDNLQANVTHFSLYKPVFMLPDAQASVSDVYAYPNPAFAPSDPVIRVAMGQVDSVDIAIYDVSGQKVHSATLSGSPSGILNGQYYYDYTWQGNKASGIYFAVIHGNRSGETIRARAKFAVIR